MPCFKKIQYGVMCNYHAEHFYLSIINFFRKVQCFSTDSILLFFPLSLHNHAQLCPHGAHPTTKFC